ncbi:uncharacterized protein [Physcomitrium patens]|uniref:uncharacterized protein isoform X3 n=1 Tax=Physcomitrium patens TaxID=3218 RepID=UPI000D177897|nr:uncharacterized protein LOC112279326 isoform X3 [Physcomitrium patens]|eukprot:XP_024369457.1 uncharacterized protein LOC112279326 isoform X3 [Physcomitrella patens]
MTPVISCHTVSYLLLCRSHSLPWNYIESNMDNWVHPCPTLHEITEHAAAYLELLVLASGFQSSGQPFSWTPANLRKALAWASHLEQRVADLSPAAEGMESRRALDSALAKLTASAPTYPAGLRCLSSIDLSSARRLLIQALLQAVVPDPAYFESIVHCLSRKDENEGEIGHDVKELVSARNRAIRSAECIGNFVDTALGCLTFEKKPLTPLTSIWRTSLTRNAVEYVTSFTTVYKTAAANLIFKTREEGWRRVLDTSLASTSSTLIGDGCGSGTEIAELCCLQLGFSECRNLAFRIFTSTLNENVATEELVCHAGREQVRHSVPDLSAEKLVSIETVLAEILEKRVDVWWILPPVLLAGVCASRFRMLKTYLHTITRGLEQNVRFCKCPCHQRSSNCQTCRQCTNVLLERLWCFGVHHPQLKNFNTQELISTCNYLLFQAKRRPI